MAVSLYDGPRQESHGFVRWMTLVNLSFTLGVLCAWPIMGVFLAGPISAAAGETVSPYGRPDYNEYPYVLLWLLPLVGVVSSYLASTLGYGSLAKFVSAYPLLLMLTCCAWFYWFSMYFA